MKQIFEAFDSTVLNMAGLRLLSASFEVIAVILMLYFNSIHKAIVINGSLALVGPIIFILTMSLGLIAIVEDISFGKLIFIAIGVGFILFGVLK